MQAVRLFGIGDLRLTECDIPTPGAGDIVIRVEAAGICGTDRHLFKGEFPSAPPVTLGHEFSGIVTAVGAGVDLPLGTRVAALANPTSARTIAPLASMRMAALPPMPNCRPTAPMFCLPPSIPFTARFANPWPAPCMGLTLARPKLESG